MTTLKPEYYGGFKKPPVIEVVCGVHFEPLQRLSTAFFGLLWNIYGESFPKTTDHPVLPPPAKPLIPGLPVRIQHGPRPPRVWFMSEDERRLIQIQQDRFHYNWRRREDSDQYPRFPEIFSAFKEYYETLIEFDGDSGGDGLKEVQYELTYVNHIPESDSWKSFQQIGNVLPDVSWRNTAERFLPAPASVRWDTQFPMPDGAGVLTVTALTARDAATGKPVITLNLTARGQAGTLEFEEWFGLAREWIVKGFIDLTDEGMQKAVWGRKEEEL